VQVERSVHGAVLLVNGRPAVRIRSPAPRSEGNWIEFGRLLKEASEGRTPDSDATVAKRLDEYAAIASWDVSTRQTNEGFIRRTIIPALGHMKVRKVRGPILDKLYAKLKRCGDLACIGKPFTQHRNIPVLMIMASAVPVGHLRGMTAGPP
jgi:hypothetical protein